MMGLSVQWQQDATQPHEALRIYDARRDSDRGGLSGEMTLAQFVECYYKPVHLLTRDARPRNLEEVDQSTKYWVRFTGDPPLSAIDAYVLRDFVVGLKQLKGLKYATLSNNTVRKHCGAIQAILDLCGPPTRDRRDSVGLLDTVPYVPRPPREGKPAEDCYTIEELRRLLENADAARLPTRIGDRPITPGTYHRRIYAIIFNTGMRIGGIMGVTWRHYHPDDRLPHLWLPPGAAKGRRGQRVELNPDALAIIESMRGFDAERVFPWPRSWPASRHALYDSGHDLIRCCLPSERRDRLAYHALRKLHTNELAEINGLACMKSLGHATVRTTIESYTSQKVVASAVARLPHLSLASERQQRLF